MAREAEVDGRARELSERELSDGEELSDEELDRPSLTAFCYGSLPMPDGKPRSW